MDLSSLLPIAIRASEEAASDILKVYHSYNFEAEAKNDNSPLTLADRTAHQKITAILAETPIPILSEEGRAIPYDERKTWEYLWMVDPLDGTKEFLKRNGEFTVNIALIHRGQPVLGVVAVPQTSDVYYAAHGTGAFVKRGDKVVELPRRQRIDLSVPGLRVVASRSHMNDDTSRFIAGLKDPVLVSKGSSLKFMMLAEGKADIYPRFAPTMEWDTAAAHAIVAAVGLRVQHATNRSDLHYNKADLLNPFFVVH